METLKSEKKYEAALEELNSLMKKGEESISDTEAERVEELGLAIQAYEKIHYPFPLPKNSSKIVGHHAQLPAR
jgi:HTH-type transcriptional regulator/antitoxin HigA